MTNVIEDEICEVTDVLPCHSIEVIHLDGCLLGSLVLKGGQPVCLEHFIVLFFPVISRLVPGFPTLR